jgi:hypothetical protein
MRKMDSRTMVEVFKIISNIKRFDDKENGADFYAGWDSCLDTVIMDLKELQNEDF